MVLDPIPQSLPLHFFGSRPQPPTSRWRLSPCLPLASRGTYYTICFVTQNTTPILCRDERRQSAHIWPGERQNLLWQVTVWTCQVLSEPKGETRPIFTCDTMNFTCDVNGVCERHAPNRFFFLCEILTCPVNAHHGICTWCALSTRRRRGIGCLKLQVIFRRRATNYRALLRKCIYTWCALSANNGCGMTRWYVIWLVHQVCVKRNVVGQNVHVLGEIQSIWRKKDQTLHLEATSEGAHSDTYVYISIFTCVYMYVWIHTYLYVYINVCIFVHVHVHVHIHIYMYIYPYVYPYMHLYIQICVYIFTYM